jgi:O-antigen/teichoic acid export membrane protein
MVESKNLTKSVIGGSFWVAAFEVSNQVLQFVKTFFAAQLLSPADFGIFGIAFLIIGFLEIISTTGMKEAVIQRRDEDPQYLNTVWTVEILKGFFVLIVSFLLSAPIASIIHAADPHLTMRMIQFIGAVYFLQCATNIGVVFFERDINFRKFFYYQFAGTIFDVAVTLILVYYTGTVMALFYGVVAGATAKVVASFVISGYRPALHFNREKAAELYRYGRWIFSSRVFNFIGLQADTIVVSSFFKLHSLGIYQMSMRIGNLPMSQMSNVIGRLAFPTFAKVNNDNIKLKNVFLTFVNVLTLVIVPVVVLIFGLIEEFTFLFLGEKWLGIVPLVRVLILSGLLRIYVSLIDSLFCAAGVPRNSSRMQLVRFIGFAVLVAPLGIYFGITGVALSGLISLIIVFVYFSGHARKIIPFTNGELMHDLFYPLLFGVILIGCVFMLKTFYEPKSMVSFFATVGGLLLLYAGLAVAANKLTSIKILTRTYSLLNIYRNKS